LIPEITAVRMTPVGYRVDLPLLVLGPSLGTSATDLWSTCAHHLVDAFDVLGWDLPGHGHNQAVPEQPFGMDELATGVLRLVEAVLTERGESGSPFFYAGDSVGGVVGLQLMLDVPDRVRAAVLLCTGARIGTAELWRDRVALVRASGTASLAAASAERWFGPGYLDREPAQAAALLRSLSDTADEGYARVCEALATNDVRDRLSVIGTPVLAVAGSADLVTPPVALREIAEGVKDGRYVKLTGVAHLAPAESSHVVARLLREHSLDGEGAR
jgi:3-oxoadipate enol-lactonase/4-carboxymuconolactone decarboxylase